MILSESFEDSDYEIFISRYFISYLALQIVLNILNQSM